MGVARVLLRSTDEALDSSWLCLNDWDVISRETGNPSTLAQQLAPYVETWPFRWIPQFRRAFSEDFLTMQKVYLALCFQQAHLLAQAEVPKYFAASDEFDLQVQQQVARESVLQCRRASELLEQVPVEAVELGKSEMLARKLLHQQIEQVRHMVEKGLLTVSEAHHLEQQIQESAWKVSNMPKDTWLAAKPNSLM